MDERPFVQQFGIRREKWPSVDDEASGTTMDGREWRGQKRGQQRRDDFNGKSLRKGANKRWGKIVKKIKIPRRWKSLI